MAGFLVTAVAGLCGLCLLLSPEASEGFSFPVKVRVVVRGGPTSSKQGAALLSWPCSRSQLKKIEIGPC